MKYMAAVLLLVAAMSAQNVPSTNKGRHLDIPAISREANGAIVSIVMSNTDGHPIAQGSGFLISKDGHVVTNYHVIKSGSSALVKLPNGTFFTVDGVLASDKNRDVAIIKAHGSNFRTLTLGDSARLQVGEEVVAIGNPLSLESTVSNGIVSAIRTVENEGGKFVQITAPISPGSSGGPLFNMAGEVVGITTSHLVGGENLNFAIPIDDVKHLTTLPRLAKARAFPDEAEDEVAASGQQVDLAQTLDWINQTFDDNQVRHSAYDIRHTLLLKGCDAGVWQADHQDQGNFHGTTANLLAFNLADIDPASIQVVQKAGGPNDGVHDINPHTYIRFTTTNNLKRINAYGAYDSKTEKWTSSYPNLYSNVPSFGNGFSVTPEYAARFTKALQHAVTLCGGKPSTF